MSAEGKFVLCSNCRSIFLDVDFAEHRCMRIDSMRRIVEVSEKGRLPLEFKPSDFEKRKSKERELR